MRTFDFSPLYRSAVGFDRLTNVLDAAQKNGAADGYPPYNIEKTSEDSYQITLAVAGFGSADLEVEVRDGLPNCFDGGFAGYCGVPHDLSRARNCFSLSEVQPSAPNTN